MRDIVEHVRQVREELIERYGGIDGYEPGVKKVYREGGSPIVLPRHRKIGAVPDVLGSRPRRPLEILAPLATGQEGSEAAQGPIASVPSVPGSALSITHIRLAVVLKWKVEGNPADIFC